MTYVILAGFFGLLLLIVYSAVQMAKEAGKEEEQARQAEKQADVTRKQAEIMSEARTDDETANRLGDGSF